MQRAYANRCGLFLTRQKRLWEYYITSCVSAPLHSWQGPCCTLHDITLHTSDCTLSSLHLCMFSSPFYPPERFPQLLASLSCQSDSSVWLFLHRKSRRNTRFINRSLVFIFGGSAAHTHSLSLILFLGNPISWSHFHSGCSPYSKLIALPVNLYVHPSSWRSVSYSWHVSAGKWKWDVECLILILRRLFWHVTWRFGGFIFCRRHQIILFLLKMTFMRYS